jgi:hypothetical protein
LDFRTQDKSKLKRVIKSKHEKYYSEEISSDAPSANAESVYDDFSGSHDSFRNVSPEQEEAIIR